ncbi:unnamed protein product [Neospora caninum Liverpool]|uniref:subtilisin n=3 Tax=Neospora TaxID=29175 RepID=F0VF24_NEOCL|eukprot:XP_003882350.1 uncharacterized protein NCLIV_021050 [Neospora caninum Liverpool]
MRASHILLACSVLIVLLCMDARGLRVRKDGDVLSPKTFQPDGGENTTDPSDIIEEVRKVEKQVEAEAAEIIKAREEHRGFNTLDDGVAPETEGGHGLHASETTPVAELEPQDPDRSLKYPVRLLIVDKPAGDEEETRPSFVQTALHSELAQRVVKELNGHVDVLDESGVVLVDLPANTTDKQLKEVIETAKAQGAIVEPDHMVSAVHTSSRESNDPLLHELWALDPLNMRAAWDILTTAELGGDRRPLVCVVDTGIDYEHPDLRENMEVNQVELHGKPGIDDDNNGEIDDIYGANMVSDSTDPADDHSHGTHVAGTIGARGDNGVGIAGIAWAPRLIACKFLNARGRGFDSDALRCINYCAKRGADIMNHSWSGSDASEALRQAIEQTAQQGIIHIAAAGNSGRDVDVTPNYPAALSTAVEGLITVGNMKMEKQRDGSKHFSLAESSNYGTKSVQIALPGTDIYSTIPVQERPDDPYGWKTGTSMAAPALSGIVALMLAANPGLSATQIRSILMQSVNRTPELSTRVTWGAMPDAKRCLDAALVTPPEGRRPGNPPSHPPPEASPPESSPPDRQHPHPHPPRPNPPEASPPEPSPPNWQHPHPHPPRPNPPEASPPEPSPPNWQHPHPHPPRPNPPGASPPESSPPNWQHPHPHPPRPNPPEASPPQSSPPEPQRPFSQWPHTPHFFHYHPYPGYNLPYFTYHQSPLPYGPYGRDPCPCASHPYPADDSPLGSYAPDPSPPQSYPPEPSPSKPSPPEGSSPRVPSPHRHPSRSRLPSAVEPSPPPASPQPSPHPSPPDTSPTKPSTPPPSPSQDPEGRREPSEEDDHKSLSDKSTSHSSEGHAGATPLARVGVLAVFLTVVGLIV